MTKHEYFTVGFAATLGAPEDGLCIFAGDAPQDHEDGSRSFSLRVPAVMITDLIQDRPHIAATVAEILNENAGRLFQSAADIAPDKDKQLIDAKAEALLLRGILDTIATNAALGRICASIEAKDVAITSIEALCRSACND